jgi:hypothetical protein
MRKVALEANKAEERSGGCVQRPGIGSWTASWCGGD